MSDRPKWTPGPWHVGAQNDALYVLDAAPSPAPYDGPLPREYGPNVVATPNWRSEEYHANAHLISAAPELYEALERLLEDAFLDISGEPIDTAYAYAALAKARGEA